MGAATNPCGGDDGNNAPQNGNASETFAEITSNYPYFRQFVYDRLREEFSKSLPELPPDVDLELLGEQEEAQPLDSFIDQIGSQGYSN